MIDKCLYKCRVPWHLMPYHIEAVYINVRVGKPDLRHSDLRHKLHGL